jgi:glyoxylase-like metal-dependent hydrolase (beta-lactamase superfamily II)
LNIHPNVYKITIWWDEIQVDVNVYLVRGRRNAIIDSGPPQLGRAAVAAAMEAMNLSISDIDFILCTHGHQDHAGGNADIKAVSNAQVCIHKDDAFFLEDDEHAFDEYYAPPIEALKGKEHVEERKRAFLQSRPVQAAIDRRLTDNDIIDLGDSVELRVVHIPGHSPGSVGFYWEKEGMLFTGDSVGGLHNTTGSLPIINDFPAYKKSMERLLGMPVSLILCGHKFRGITLPPAELRYDDDAREYLQDSLYIAGAIEEQARRVSSGAQPSLAEVTEAVIAGLPKEMGFKPVAELPKPSFSTETVFWCLRGLGVL